MILGASTTATRLSLDARPPLLILSTWKVIYLITEAYTKNFIGIYTKEYINYQGRSTPSLQN